MQSGCTKAAGIFVLLKYPVMQVFIPYFSTLFFVSYMLVAFVWPSVRIYRRTGINPVVFGNTDTAHDLTGRMFKVTLALVPVSIICYWAGADTYRLLLPVTYLDTAMAHIIGAILCLTSFVWTVIAQRQMDSSWRIGIDTEHATGLVTKGLFRFSRNPVFLGMILTLTGFFLLLPNALTLLILGTGYVLIQVQIRLEEAFLLTRHGNSYLQYKAAVRRLL